MPMASPLATDHVSTLLQPLASWRRIQQAGHAPPGFCTPLADSAEDTPG